MLIIGLDPGLGCTGWGVIAAEGNRLSHVANGQVRTDPRQSLPARLVRLEEELGRVLEEHRPASAAVEEVFLNENPQSTLKLGQARGVVLLAAARRGLEVGGDDAGQLVRLLDALEEDDDVQTVSGNYEVSDEVMERLG